MKTLILAAIRCALIFMAAAALSVAYPAKANLITNGGFETGDNTGWEGFMLVTGPFFGISPHSGNFQAVTPLPGDFNSTGQTVATTPGQSYTIDLWMASVGENGTGLADLVLGGGGTIFSHLFEGPTAYTEFTGNFTASSASSDLGFLFTVGFDSFLLLDDVSVTPTGVPDGGSTVSLLGCALLGLVALRRKLSC